MVKKGKTIKFFAQSQKRNKIVNPIVSVYPCDEKNLSPPRITSFLVLSCWFFFFFRDCGSRADFFFFLFWCITFSHGRCTGTSRVRHHFSELGRALSEVGIPKLDKKEKKSDIEKNEKNEKKKEKRKR